MNVWRVLKHLALPNWLVRRDFPKATLNAIEAAIANSEARHAGELRFVVEGGLPLPELLRNRSPRRRAADVFAQARVWDTELNCGVLIYVQWVDHAVEILADRGIAARVPQTEWNAVCRTMEAAFRHGDYRGGSLAAIERVDVLLREHFPVAPGDRNELPNRPLML